MQQQNLIPSYCRLTQITAPLTITQPALKLC